MSTITDNYPALLVHQSLNKREPQSTPTPLPTPRSHHITFSPLSHFFFSNKKEGSMVAPNHIITTKHCLSENSGSVIQIWSLRGEASRWERKHPRVQTSIKHIFLNNNEEYGSCCGLRHSGAIVNTNRDFHQTYLSAIWELEHRLTAATSIPHNCKMSTYDYLGMVYLSYFVLFPPFSLFVYSWSVPSLAIPQVPILGIFLCSIIFLPWKARLPALAPFSLAAFRGWAVVGEDAPGFFRLPPTNNIHTSPHPSIHPSTYLRSYAHPSLW